MFPMSKTALKIVCCLDYHGVAPPPKFVDKIGIFMFTNQLSNTHSVSFKGMSKFAVNVAILSRKQYHVH